MTAYQDLASASASRLTSSRVLVMLVAAGWLLLASPWPVSLHGMAIVIVLALLFLGTILGVLTDWLAFRPSSLLDEREMALRDRSNRIAFRLIAVGILLMFVLSIAGGFAEMGRGSQTAAQLPEGFSGRTIAALITLLVILPTAVIAWLQPVDGELWPFRLQTWVPLLAVPLIGIAWLAATTLAPEQTLTRVGSNGGFSEANVTCEHYAGQQRVGFEFGGAIRVGAEVCWNGQKAFVVGDPSLTPAGADLPPEASFIPFFNDLVSCAPYPTDADFANVTQQCTEQIDDLGTMHLLVTGLVSPTPLSLGKRHLQIELVVDRNGKVLRFD